MANPRVSCQSLKMKIMKDKAFHRDPWRSKTTCSVENYARPCFVSAIRSATPLVPLTGAPKHPLDFIAIHHIHGWFGHCSSMVVDPQMQFCSFLWVANVLQVPHWFWTETHIAGTGDSWSSNEAIVHVSPTCHGLSFHETRTPYRSDMSLHSMIAICWSPDRMISFRSRRPGPDGTMCRLVHAIRPTHLDGLRM